MKLFEKIIKITEEVMFRLLVEADGDEFTVSQIDVEESGGELVEWNSTPVKSFASLEDAAEFCRTEYAKLS